jgi:hypothetical protein
MKFNGILLAGLLLSSPAFAAPAYYSPVDNIAALSAYAASSPFLAHAAVKGIGNYDYEATCPGTVDGFTFVAVTGIPAACWTLWRTPHMPNGHFVSSGNPGSTTWIPNVGAMRGEIIISPNDTGGLDPQAGGEITLLSNQLGATDNVGMALRANRVAGVLDSFSTQQITTGAAVTVPMSYGPNGFGLGMTFNPDGSAENYSKITVKGGFPALSLGTLAAPLSGPQINFYDSSAPATAYGVRVTAGVFGITNITAGSLPFSIGVTGHVFMPNLDGAATLTPNMVYNASTGELTRTATVGVSCSGAPTAGFTTSGGIVTAC